MANSKVKKARDTVGSVGSNPYLKRLMEDEDLRTSLKDAVDAARDAFDRLSSNGDGPINTAIDDKKVHKDLKTAAENLREASDRIRGKKKKRHWGRVFLLGAVGAALAVALSEDVRKTVLDKLFGAEEEFEYSSTTSAAATPAGSTSS